MTDTRHLFEEIEINFILAGHTKFSPDRHLGHVKKQLNQSDNVETFPDAVEVISVSAKNQIVKPTRNFDTDTGNQNVIINDWKNLLLGKYSRPASKLRLYTSHFFKIKWNSPKIEYRTSHDSEPMFTELLKAHQDDSLEPQIMRAEEVSNSREEELKKIEKFITPRKNKTFWKAIK